MLSAKFAPNNFNSNRTTNHHNKYNNKAVINCENYQMGHQDIKWVNNIEKNDINTLAQNFNVWKKLYLRSTIK